MATPAPDLPNGFSHEVCAVTDEQGMTDKLRLAKNRLQCKEAFGDYFNAKFHKGLKRVDNAPVKRVELHANTKMNTMDGIVSATDLVGRAAEWGHAVAYTITAFRIAWFKAHYPEAFYTAIR